MSTSGTRPQSPRRRKFYEIPEQQLDEREIERNGVSDSKDSKTQQGAEIASLIRSSVIGSDAAFNGPFGVRPIVYCDFVASGTESLVESARFGLGFLEIFMEYVYFTDDFCHIITNSKTQSSCNSIGLMVPTQVDRSPSSRTSSAPRCCRSTPTRTPRPQ